MAVNGDAKDSTGRAEFEPVVADMDGNVDTNEGNVNIPEAAANEPATTIAGVEQTLDAGGRGQLVGSAVRMIRAIVTSLPVKRGILSSFENGANDFAASNDFFFQPSSGWGLLSC